LHGYLYSLDIISRNTKYCEFIHDKRNNFVFPANETIYKKPVISDAENKHIENKIVNITNVSTSFLDKLGGEVSE